MKLALCLCFVVLVSFGCAVSRPAATLTREQEIAAVAKEYGTNYLGVHLGMIAVRDKVGSVQLYSATSGQLLRWISYAEFRDVYILKIRPEYPPEKFSH